MREIYRTHEPKISLFDDAHWALGHFAQEGPIGLITDGTTEMQTAKVKALAIAGSFEEIIYTHEGGGRDFHKPHPWSYERMETAIGQPGDRFVYVGDNASKDFLTPNARGWPPPPSPNSPGIVARASSLTAPLTAAPTLRSSASLIVSRQAATASSLVAGSSFWVRAQRWRVFLRPVGRIPFHPALSATCIGFGATMVLPLRLGEFIRPALLARRVGISVSAAFSSVVLERLFDGESDVIISSEMFCWLVDSDEIERLRRLAAASLSTRSSSACRHPTCRLDAIVTAAGL